MTRLILQGLNLSANWLYSAETRLQRLIPRTWGWCRCWHLFVWNWSNAQSVSSLDRSQNASSGLDGPRWATYQDLDLLSQQVPRSTVCRRIDLGGMACVIACQGQLEAVAWFQREQYEDLDTGCLFQLADHQAWLFGAWVNRRKRKRGFYSSILQFAQASLANQFGTQQVFLAVDKTNRNSACVHRRLGADCIGKLSGGQFRHWIWGAVTWYSSNQTPGPPTRQALSPDKLIRLDQWTTSPVKAHPFEGAKRVPEGTRRLD